ncbi:putative nuclease HARBI1 [Monomorium pharaonis]|uniref:putative nuclease HARBI1 n=1 Tax=Monomorium pharaonis TaxID=307658 RepID=UPI0017468983|nr:putative nuclease HARBI1 [Monomorium pharaonis]
MEVFLFINAASSDILKTALALDLSESESESETEEFLNFIIPTQVCRLRGKRGKAIRIEGYVNNVVPRFSSRQFKEHFRMTPNCFSLLENKLSPMLENNNIGRSHISPRVQLLAVLWLLATPDSYRSVGLQFNLAKSSLNHCVRRVIQALCNISSDIIKWPSVTNMSTIKDKFKRIAGLENVLGAIDGSYIEIPAPSIDAHCYLTRKCRYAVILQAVCDADLRFTDCYAGYPGSVGDLRVFRNSDLWYSVNRNRHFFFPNEEFIIGDKAYPSLGWCLTAYRDNGHLTQIENNFNYILSQTRQTVERAFALLKGRLRRLKYLDMSRVDLIPATILACCVLHNICLGDIDDEIENYVVEGNRENEQNRENNEECEHIENYDNEGITKRNYLATILFRRR